MFMDLLLNKRAMFWIIKPGKSWGMGGRGGLPLQDFLMCRSMLYFLTAVTEHRGHLYTLLLSPSLSSNIKGNILTYIDTNTHLSDRENEFKCKTVLIRKVTNFIEKNACRLV